MKHKYLLLLIIAFGFLIRVYKITSLPLPPNGDELAFGYYGWSLLHFGTDEYVNKFPVSFISIGDLKYPLLSYMNIIPAAFFGLTQITTRFWGLVAGVLLIPLIYKLSLIFFEDKKTALLTSVLMAIMPWALIESRLGYENLPATTLVTFAFYLILYSAKKTKENFRTKKILKPISTFILFLCLFLYAAARVFTPLFLAFLIAFSFFNKSSLKPLRGLLFKLFILITISVLVSISSPQLKGRSTEEMWKGLSHDQTNHLEEIYVQAGKSPIQIPPRITWLFHNKYKIATIDFLKRYTDHFSFKFLFFEAEASIERLPDMGVLAYYDLVFLPLGIYFLIKEGKPQESLIIFFWLFISPIASALTFGGAHINRASMMIVPLAVISGYGLSKLVSLFKNGILKKLTVFATSAAVVYFGCYSLNQLLIQKPLDRPWYKEQVYKEVSSEVLNLRGSYDAVAVGDDDYIYFLFYGKITPKEFIKNSEITPFNLVTNRWERVNRLYNIYFKMPFNCPKGGKQNVLYVCSGDEIPKNVKVVKVFHYLDYVPAFSLVEFYPLSEMPKTLPEPPKGFKYMVEAETSPLYPDGIIPESFGSLW